MKNDRKTIQYKDGRDDSGVAHKGSVNVFDYDWGIVFPVLFLIGIGIVMVYSSSSTLAAEKYGSDYYFLKKQAIFATLGIVLMIITRRIPCLVYKKAVYLILFTAVGLLIAVQVSGLGVRAGGAVRWINFGFVTFQPAELARFALVIYLAYSLSKKGDKVKEFSIGFIPHFVVLGIFVLLIFMQPDFGSVLILTALTWIMLYVGGVRIKHLIIPLLGLLPALAFLMVTAEYRLRRLMTFLNPWDYSTSDGYQIVHSLMAFGSGGIFGSGVGNGYQKLFYLPEPHTDFIISVVGEELGFVGVFVVLSLYFIIFLRGLAIAKNAEDLFSGYVAMGLVLSFGFQVCINLGVCLGLLPTKGLALPFLSYGGTSLLMNMTAMGILMNIGKTKAV